MLQCGTQVVYGIHGVCNILETEVKIINRKKVEYYVLQPLEHPEARYYVPVDNPVAVEKMKPLLTSAGVDALFCNDEISNQKWIDDENHRRQYYKTLINSGDRVALIGMIRLLYQHKKAQISTGRKFHQSDENFLKDAEKVLSSELSQVLNIPRGEVGAYIRQRLDG